MLNINKYVLTAKAEYAALVPSLSDGFLLYLVCHLHACFMTMTAWLKI
jgi:hypothetical protein